MIKISFFSQTTSTRLSSTSFALSLLRYLYLFPSLCIIYEQPSSLIKCRVDRMCGWVRMLSVSHEVGITMSPTCPGWVKIPSCDARHHKAGHRVSSSTVKGDHLINQFFFSFDSPHFPQSISPKQQTDRPTEEGVKKGKLAGKHKKPSAIFRR
jgi:hypothetical protein